ncbi:MAG TPA: ABC transporter ATP-binding protein, partial [Chloroflexota bacterium]|nr:ABC transporter ATP-binding protein [Chloroflexota bacterium]
FAAGVLTIGTVYHIYSYAELLRRPVEQLTQQFQDLHQAGGSIVRIRQLLDTPDDVSDGSQRPPVGAPAVAFEGVTFVYPTNEEGRKTNALMGGASTGSSIDLSSAPALSQLSFRLEAGQVLGVVGRTGSGKTTLARLLFRLYDPNKGTIRLGGVDIRTIQREELRRIIGLITQEVQLFAASVRDNLTFFDPSVPDEHLRALLHDLELGGWFESLPQGLDTILHGGGLSAGEAQLLAFARVFLKDPALVVLDEASSRLDPATDRRLERALDTLLRHRTGIIIAHRLRTVQRADQILVLDNGRAVEYGPRAALAADPASRFSQLLHDSGGKGVLHEA